MHRFLHLDGHAHEVDPDRTKGFEFPDLVFDVVATVCGLVTPTDAAPETTDTPNGTPCAICAEYGKAPELKASP